MRVGVLKGNADQKTPEGYQLWVKCRCGARFERWVTPEDAEADLLRSALLAFETWAAFALPRPSPLRLAPSGQGDGSPMCPPWAVATSCGARSFT